MKIGDKVVISRYKDVGYKLILIGKETGVILSIAKTQAYVQLDSGEKVRRCMKYMEVKND